MIQENGQPALLLMFNAGVTDVDFKLPPLPKGSRWHLAVDTSRPTPQDLFAAGAEALLDHSQAYRLQQHSSAILLARGQDDQPGQLIKETAPRRNTSRSKEHVSL